jgi:hypothetical protein
MRIGLNMKSIKIFVSNRVAVGFVDFSILGVFAGLFMLASCSQKEPMPEGLMFSGKCKVAVESTPKEAELFVDGIAVGQGSAEVEVPCGEKQILVEQHGYVPYYAYHAVDKNKTLKVAVSLKKLDKSRQNFALSDEIINQIKDGEHLWDPSQGPRPEVKGEESAPAYLGDLKALVASVQGVKAQSAASGAEEFETGTWDSVEDWR